MKKKATEISKEGPATFFRCPFCEHYQAVNNAMAWCATCFNEYTVSTDKKGRTVIDSDTEKRTEKYAWAKAVGRSGGVKLGKTDQ